MSDKPYCINCKHEVRMLNKDWLCTQNCRCLMLGCVPYDPKWGKPPVPEFRSAEDSDK